VIVRDSSHTGDHFRWMRIKWEQTRIHKMQEAFGNFSSTIHVRKRICVVAKSSRLPHCVKYKLQRIEQQKKHVHGAKNSLWQEHCKRKRSNAHHMHCDNRAQNERAWYL